MTARWVVDAVQPQRDVSITWQPISLLEKNQPAEGSDYHAPVLKTHKMLRVMESLRAAAGDDAAFQAYWAFATRIHHDRDLDFDVVAALTEAGLDPAHAEALEDESFDAEIRSRMAEGLALAGDDIGTPIIAMDDDNGERVAMFGPVITRVPDDEAALKLWDGFVAITTTPGVWEIKRTRTERPDFGDRPG